LVDPVAASPTQRLSRRALRWIGRFVAALVLLVGMYLLAAWIGSSIPRNGDWHQPESGGVVIAVETNGVHTALVMPLVTPAKDWRKTFPLADVARPNRPYTHVSISWGEREVFLDTPTWWDLSPLLVLKILTKGGEGLEHVAFYVRPGASETMRPIRITDAQYTRLVQAIEARLPQGQPLVKHAGYGGSDVFYDAGGRYTAVNTCNQWTGNRLADAGVRVGRWTPLDSSVMKWAPLPRTPYALSFPGAPAAAR
jgi:uncharacterized protein (TIGR02117 family)